jgi:putative transposase
LRDKAFNMPRGRCRHMTIEEVVRKVLLDEQADVLRVAVEAVCAEVMEIEVAQRIGAKRGERRPDDRATHRNGDRARKWQSGWDGRAADPQAAARRLLPGLLGGAPGSEQALLAVIEQCYVCGSRPGASTS